jgi:hypothetical protein
MKRPKPKESTIAEDRKTTRWYFRYHKAEHEKARRFGGYEFGDLRCPVCQLWNRVMEMKAKFRGLGFSLYSNVRRAERLLESCEKLSDV